MSRAAVERRALSLSKSRGASADGNAGLRAADAEGEDAIEQSRVVQSDMPGREGDFLALGDFRIGIGFDEIQRAVGREAEVDARVSIETERLVDAFRRSLDAGA